MREHELKCAAEFFDAVESGRKPFEVRFNDRDFKVGDHLELVECNILLEPTGRRCHKVVTYVLAGWGIERGSVCMGLARGDGRSDVARVRELEWALRCMLNVFGQDGLGDGAEGDAVCIARACFPSKGDAR